MPTFDPRTGELPERPRVKIDNFDQSRTKQSYHAGSTVQAILKKYALMGISVQQQRDIFAAGIAAAPFGIQRAHDYQRELNQVVAVQQYFDALPATTRDKFRNDPFTMLTWLADEGNHAEARKLKLLPELAATAPAGGAPVAPPTPNTTTGGNP